MRRGNDLIILASQSIAAIIFCVSANRWVRALPNEPACPKRAHEAFLEGLKSLSRQSNAIITGGFCGGGRGINSVYLSSQV